MDAPENITPAQGVSQALDGGRITGLDKCQATNSPSLPRLTQALRKGSKAQHWLSVTMSVSLMRVRG